MSFVITSKSSIFVFRSFSLTFSSRRFITFTSTNFLYWSTFCSLAILVNSSRLYIDKKNIKEFAKKHVEESIVQDEINEQSQFSGNVNKFKFLTGLLENFATNSKHARAIEGELNEVRKVEHKYLQSLKDRLTPVKATDNLEPKNKYSYFISTSYENLYKENGIRWVENLKF